MKIEKISDNQIRCTLTKADLADRELKISELAYGTEKAKSLFRDMMQQAAYEFGFEAEDLPLMIEAIPLSQDGLVLVITKVDDPEELDTRFSKFAPELEDGISESEAGVASISGADDILDIFKRIREEKLKLENSLKKQDDKANNFVPLFGSDSKNNTSNVSDKKNDTVPAIDLTKLYAFKDLDTVTRLSYILNGYYYGRNSLYKDQTSGEYLLSVSKSNHTPEEFNKVCNILSEYGFSKKYNSATESFLNEHSELFIKEEALQKLAAI